MAGIEVLIWEFKSAQKRICEVMCCENESTSEQKRKQQVMDQLLHLPQTELINLLWKPPRNKNPQNSIWRLRPFFIRVPFPHAIMLWCHQNFHAGS